MSHALGARCAVCGQVLVTIPCPERECAGVLHGWADTHPSPWAAQQWPSHPCFAEMVTTS